MRRPWVAFVATLAGLGLVDVLLHALHLAHRSVSAEVALALAYAMLAALYVWLAPRLHSPDERPGQLRSMVATAVLMGVVMVVGLLAALWLS